ncbi:MAG: Gfo/Idh/MocA family oxidoreductase [Bacteriovoracaceae bacterium]|jgi:predicted dehydrogenase|nr:Gfo/Idh/MocA family oxidoreductase [Bacteriovoracaceae bacterium]
MLSLLIVGLGNIGFRYDENLSKENFILSHARAACSLEGYNLQGGVDTSQATRDDFFKKYNVPVFETLEDALEKLSPDVVVISSPTEFHYDHCSIVLKYSKVKAIICEKPIAYTVDQASEIVERCREKGVNLYVNYMRRSNPGVIKLKELIKSGNLGKDIKGFVWYAKGFLHNGSHYFNLLEYLFGEMLEFKMLSKGRTIPDFGPEPDVWVKFEDGSFVFQALNEESFSHYDMEIIGSKGRIRYENGGKNIYHNQVSNHPDLANYKVLETRPSEIPSEMNIYQKNVYEEVLKDLNSQPAKICTGEEALSTLMSMTKILKEII